MTEPKSPSALTTERIAELRSAAERGEIEIEHLAGIRELCALATRALKLEAALRCVAQSGDEIKDMASAFIDSRDRNSLENYGGNIASIARAALVEGAQ